MLFRKNIQMNLSRWLFQSALPIVLLLLSTKNVSAQGLYFNILPINGNYSFNYNQVPESIVSLNPAITGYTFQWESSPTPFPLTSFTTIGGATGASLTFSAALPQTTYYRRKAKNAQNVEFISNTVKISVVSLNWENLSYVREHDVLVAGQTDWKLIDQLTIGNKLQSTTYMDGIGRPIQKVIRETALQSDNTTWGDAVQFSKFDVFGRQDKKYLPYTTTSQPGKYKTAAITDQTSYFTNKYNESAPYNQVTEYDNSPLNRSLTVKESGTNWAASDGSKVRYELNDATDNVQNFTIGYNTSDKPVSLGVYAVNTLFKTIYIDENHLPGQPGKQVIDYTDQSGKLILKKVQLDEVPASAYTGWICTYSVYDDFGKLRFRLQPEAVKWLAANGWSFAAANGQTIADELCFRYEYDEQGRTTMKKAPGAKPLYMLYDNRDRVVFMQDGNQRLKSPAEWTANLYDELDRPVITTLYRTVKTIANLQTDINNATIITPVTIVNPGNIVSNLVVNNRLAGIARYIATNSIELVTDAAGDFESVIGDEFTVEIDAAAATQSVTVTTATYQNPITGTDLANTTVATILKYFFYDTYSYTSVRPFSTAFDNAQAYASGGDPIAKTDRTINMPTGTMVRILGTSSFLTSSFYYDDKGRPIQVSEDNIKNGIDITTNQFQWDGRLLSSASRHTSGGSGLSNYAIVTKNNFDKIGRVTSIDKKYGSNTFKKIATYDMDDMGRLKIKHLDPGYTNITTGKTELESLTYSYNIHNQITGINRDYALKAGGYGKWGNYFGLALGFDKNESIFTNTLRTGQVSGLVWNTQGDDAQRKYDFTYDNAGRLTNALFTERQLTTDNWNAIKLDFTVTGYNGKIEYDLNGNLLTMLQKGVIPGNNTPKIIDDLRYTYSPYSNKLTKVADLGANTVNLGTSNGKLGDFAGDENPPSDDYVYDDNGNLIIDLNKNATNVTGGVTTAIGTSGIRYNFLDKPEEINITGKGTIKIVYDADGNKLQKAFIPTTGSATITTYINEFVYEEVTTTVTTASIPPLGGAGTLNLQYINFEEGRIRVMSTVNQSNGFDFLNIDGNIDLPGSGTPVLAGKGAFDYFIRDYQGNVRMILTEETHSGGNVCTMELNRVANEEPLFGQVDAAGVPTAANEVKGRFATSGIPGQTGGGGWTNNTSAYVARLGNLASKKTGPNVLVKVMAGDEISATSMYYYQTTNTNTAGGPSLITDVINGLISAITGSSTTSGLLKGNTSLINTQLTANGPFKNIAEPDYNSTLTSAPKAYLTILFFDERFNLVEEGSVSQRVSQPGPNAIDLSVVKQKAPKNGYCYVYVSNESDQMVYFDNLQVSNIHARIIEENHYYAYGLKIAGISSRKLPDPAEGHTSNKDLYNDKELWDEADLNWYDYGFRNYDPQIGRFPQLDPLTDEYPELTPFQYGSCDPIMNIDLDGLEGWSSLGSGVAAVQTLTDVVITSAKTVAKSAPGFFAKAGKFLSKTGQFLGGVVGGVVKGASETIKFVNQDMWQKDTWKSMSSTIAVAAIANGSGGNAVLAKSAYEYLDKNLGTDLGETYGAMSKGLDKFAENIPNMSAGDWGDATGQLIFAIAGSKGAGGIKNAAKLRAVKLLGKTGGKNIVKYLGRMEDLKGISRSQTIIDELPNLGSPKANYYQNMSVIRRKLREGVTFKDASSFRPNSELAPTILRPTRTVGQTFYGAERNLMINRKLWPKSIN